MLGGVPSFIKLFPKAGARRRPGRIRKPSKLSEDTALSPKMKSLISLAVAAQIPCNYCVWADTMSARQAGATDEEIAEAVGHVGADPPLEHDLQRHAGRLRRSSRRRWAAAMAASQQ